MTSLKIISGEVFCVALRCCSVTLVDMASLYPSNITVTSVPICLTYISIMPYIQDKALALNRKAQIYVAGLPLRWDKPEIKDSILNLNAYLEHKSKKLGRINYINNNIFTRCRKTHYSVDKLHLNNQGKDLMARNIEMMVNFHTPKNFPRS